jgi:hypothetical protein
MKYPAYCGRVHICLVGPLILDDRATNFVEQGEHYYYL